MTAPDLLPCPFCGNDDIQDWGESTWSRPVKWMYCTECQARGPRVMLERNESEEAWHQRIITEWNTRATPAAMTPEVRADSFDALIADARAEAEKAMRKFPQPNYVISKVAEEAGEVVKAAIHAAEGRETMQNLRGEMRQTIAMLYRLWVEGDQVHGLPPVDAALRAGGDA